MGMFDNFLCQYPLPDNQVQDCHFQSKDFDCCLDTFIITKEGRLVKAFEYKDDTWKCYDTRYHGIVNIYASVVTDHPQCFEQKWFEYDLKFTDGQLTSIEKVSSDNEYNHHFNFDGGRIIEIKHKRSPANNGVNDD